MFSVNRSGGRSRISNFDTNRHRSSSIGMHRNIESSACKSRDSYGSNYQRRASSEERKSVNSVMRRYSGVRNSLCNEPKGISKETRPLSDKVYQKKKANDLYEFLLQYEFKAPITQTKLLQPSKKEYEMIFQFLVNFWEPTFEVKNLEEDAPKLLKVLGYPFTLNKSLFMYVARTNFSSLLGVLLFLMDHAKFSLNVDLPNLLLAGDPSNEHFVLMKYIYECYPDLSNEEEMVEVFEKIIRSRDDQDLGNLEQERDLRKEKLKDVKKQLEIIEQLQKSIEETNVRIKCYEEYFVDMEKFKEKKEASILKLTEEVEEKRTMLRDQEEILSKKQALYDAQGFDGKKHLTHFEELKKELNENLQQNRASLRNLQEECWSLDIEYTKILDKGKELSKKLIQTISQVSDVVKASFQNLRNIKDPQVQNVCNSFRIEIPECPTDSSQRAFMAWIDAHKEALEEIQKKIVKTIIIIKTIISAKTEERTSIEMKKIQLSAKLKCSSSVEFQKEHDLANLEKLAVEEVRALKDKCDKDLSKFEELQKDKREKFDKLSKLKSDMQEVLKIKKNKSEMLEKFKREHEKMVAILKSKLETAINESEEYGFEIVAELQELITKYKRETE